MLVGKYELGRTLGCGRSSKVKLAVHTETQEEFVVKIISKKASSARTCKEIREEVRIEIAIMKLLDHRNIVKMHEVMESTNHYYLVLESVRGGDLCEAIIEHGKLSEFQVAKFLRDLVRGLQVCHDAGVAHRDIKPENLLISSKGELKLADFGLSRLHKHKGEELTESSTDVVGTLSYVAPEVFDGCYNAYLADLWSVGVLVFVMTTGRFPFGAKGGTSADLQRDIKKGKLNHIPVSVSPQARDVIVKLLRVKPADRISLEELLVHPFLATVPETVTDKLAECESLAELHSSDSEGGLASPLCEGGARHKLEMGLLESESANLETEGSSAS